MILRTGMAFFSFSFFCFLFFFFFDFAFFFWNATAYFAQFAIRGYTTVNSLSALNTLLADLAL